MKLGCLIDREHKGLRYGAPVVILSGRVASIVEEPRRRGHEALRIPGKRKAESLTIGCRLLVRER